MRALRLVVLASIAALVLAVAGCGDSGDDSNKTLSYSDLTAKANAICQDVTTKTKALPAPTDSASLATNIEKTLEIADPAVNDLEELQPPPELEADYQQFTTLLEENNSQAEQLAAAAKADNQEQIEQLSSEVDATNTKVNEQATKIGLTECAKD